MKLRMWWSWQGLVLLGTMVHSHEDRGFHGHKLSLMAGRSNASTVTLTKLSLRRGVAECLARSCACKGQTSPKQSE